MSLMTPEFDWGTLGAALDIVDHYVARIETFMKDNDTSDTVDSWHGEDAIMVCRLCIHNASGY